MINDLIVRVFASRNAAHLAHWAEKSGYRHETLGSFYDDVISALDSVVELYQGAFELVELTPAEKKSSMVPPDKDDILDLLEDDLDFIAKNRKKITEGIPAIDNLLQELERVYLKTVYKLRNLK